MRKKVNEYEKKRKYNNIHMTHIDVIYKQKQREKIK